MSTSAIGVGYTLQDVLFRGPKDVQQVIYTFYRVGSDLRSTDTPANEITKKTQKNRYFCRKSVFFAQKRSKGRRYIVKRCY